LVKFYTFENKGKLVLNFWKLNNYGRFTGQTCKFTIAENLESDPKLGLLKNIQHGYQYDFLTVRHKDSKQDTHLRAVYHTTKIFDQEEDISKKVKITGKLSQE
jgi:hypothetical protein